MKKRILALLLVLSMLVSVVPIAFAQEAPVAEIGNETYNTLQDAIDHATDGDTITLLTDCAENVTVTQAPNVKITINGNHKTYTGSITVDGKSATYVTAGLTIKNVNFDASSITKDACINLGVSGNNNTRYICNLSVQDCTFTGGNKAKVAIKSYTGGDKNLTVTGCIVDNTMHSIVQVTGVDGVVIDDCTVNSKNGINLTSSQNVEIKNSTISVSGYAVRAGASTGGGSGKITLSNNTLKTDNTEGDAVVVLRGVAAQKVVLTMSENVVSGETHISGTTADTNISADDNYWDGGKPVVDGTEITVNTWYTDKDLTEQSKTLKYVSLGASNVNGYGLRGYVQGDMDEAALDHTIKDDANVFGYGSETPGSYPVLIADELEMNLDQLAISSMRAEELRILLDNDYYGDSYSEWRFVGSGKWFEIAEPGGLEALRAAYQEKIANADLITVDIGVNNFGVYISSQMTNGHSYDNDLSLIDPEMAAQYEAGKAYVRELIAQYAPALELTAGEMDEFVDTLAYALVGFCVNFDAVMEEIYALNPDATVVAVSIQNLMDGLYVTVPGMSDPLPLGDLFGALINAANTYIAVGSPYADKYLCADVRQDGRVEFFLDDILAYDGNPASLNQNIIDCFNVYDGTPGTSYYKGLHVKFLVRETLYNELGEYYTAVLPTAYDVVASILQGAAKANVLDLSALAFMGDIEEALMLAIMSELNTAGAAFPYDYELPATFFEGVAAVAGVSVSAVETVAALAVRTSLGNSFFGHPNPNGHQEIADAIVSTLENGTTGEDIVEDELIKIAEDVVAWIAEYYDDIYAVVYDKVDEQGYIAAAVAGLTYAQTQIAAIDVDALDLSDAMKAELKEEAALAIQAIESLKTLLLTADELDNDTLVAAQALLSNLTDALENMNDILTVAGTDLENVVREELGKLEAAVRAEISAAIERAETALENLKNYIDEDLAPAVRAEIEKLIETIEGQLAYLQAVVEGTVEATVAEINKALAALEQAVTDLVKAAQNEANQLLEAMLNELKALAQATVAEFQATIYDATHISLNIYEDQYYVSLGGATANGAGVGRNDPIYSDLLVDALEAEGMDVTSVDLTKADLTYDGLVDYVKANAAEIAKATLITYNMDASGFVTALLGNEPDWSAYFDEAEVKAAIAEIQAEVLALPSRLAAELDAEALAALAQAEQNVLAALNEQVDPETAKEIAPYAEKLLYAAVSYAVETAKALEAIHQINPDAEVILVGMYNPLAGTTVTVGGEVIDLGEIMEYAMEATDLYHLIYAAASGNVAFVDVSDTAVNGLGNLTVDDPKLLINSLGGILMNAGAQISANVEGHAYIAEQIIDAIDFVGLLGDINLDGEVGSLDAAAALDAIVGKITLNDLQKYNGDVNFDGSVDSLDAARILDYVVGKIQSFE